MTILYTPHFKLDLSYLKIKFSESNNFFDDKIIKQQSFPFKLPKERSFIPFFEFISSHNSIDSDQYIEGILFRNDNYYKAELLLLGVNNSINLVIYYYTQEGLFNYEEKLNSLDWGTIDVGQNIYNYASQTVLKDYPTTLINFVQIYDPDAYKDYDFGIEEYAGYINYNVGGVFQPTVFDTIYGVKATRINEMRPFLYLKEVIKFIFSEIGYTVEGDFIENNSIGKCLLYHSNPIYYTNKGYSRNENLTLTLSQPNVSGYDSDYLTYNEYVKTITISSYGTYNVKLSVEGVILTNGEGCFIRCYFNDNRLTGGLADARNRGSGDFYRDLELEFHVEKDEVGSTFEVRIITTANTKPTISGELEITGTLRPLYKNAINLKDLLPDVTVGEFVNAVKESFNMSSVFNPSTKTVRFDFFNSFIDNKPALDLSRFVVASPVRKFNRSIGYKIVFSNDEVLKLNKEGEFVSAQLGFTEKKLPIEPLPVKYIDTLPNVQHQDGLSLLFFKSNADAKPLVVEGDIMYSRLGFVHTFLRNWYYQNLNSEEYKLTVNLPIDVSAKLNAESKIWFYNNYYIVHNITRQNINPLFERVSLRLFKIKNYPIFDSIITTEYEPPTAFTSSVSWGTVLVTQFNATINNSPIGGPSYFTIDIFANNSTDPQGLPLSFGWEILSSPDGNASGTFNPQNAEHSITRFTNSSYINLAGDYMIRLTVVNSVGLSDFVDITVTASSGITPPENRIVLTKLDLTDIVNTVARFTVSFVDISPSSIDIHMQEVQTGTSLPIGSPVITQISNLGLSHHEVPIPSAGSWQVKAYAGAEFSNKLGWMRIF